MRNTTIHNKYIGPVVQMPYLLADEWHTRKSMLGIRIFMSIYCILTFLITFVLYFVLKYRRGKQTWTSTLLFWINFSNAFIFTVLINAGWATNTFVAAAAHNALEFVIVLALYKKFFVESLFHSKKLYGILVDIAYIVGFLSVIPHFLITDFVLGSKIKAVGGISDVILFLVSLGGFIRYMVDVFRRYVLKNHQVKPAPRRHVALLITTLSHTTTVMLTFAACFLTTFQFIVIVVGTLIMNGVGAIYFLFQILDKPPAVVQPGDIPAVVEEEEDGYE